jgi:uncharacterized protein (DUF1684 family)
MNEYLELLDWRRRVASLYAEWRAASEHDPATATDAFRAGRDRLLRDHPQSPVPAVARATFAGDWWRYDPAWRLAARLAPVDDAGGPHDEQETALELPSSGAGALRFRRVGRLALSGPLAGSRLSAYWIEGYAGGLFVPFRDATSGTETYGAGRYLLDTVKGADHGVDESGDLILDFNLAYHPSCAYDPRWVCPLAPPENRLTVAVAVGERLTQA